MAKGMNWDRAKARKPTDMHDQEARGAERMRQRSETYAKIRSRGKRFAPRMSKDELRKIAAEAVSEHAKKTGK